MIVGNQWWEVKIIERIMGMGLAGRLNEEKVDCEKSKHQGTLKPLKLEGQYGFERTKEISRGENITAASKVFI